MGPSTHSMVRPTIPDATDSLQIRWVVVNTPSSGGQQNWMGGAFSRPGIGCKRCRIFGANEMLVIEEYNCDHDKWFRGVRP